MKLLRLLLVALLSLSFPATALTVALSSSECTHPQPAGSGAAVAEMHHSMNGEAAASGHDMHAAHIDAAHSPPDNACSHCQTGHCANGSASALAIDGAANSSPLDTSTGTVPDPHSQTALAHTLGLLRPPA
jgi:hypothetical protein